MINIAPEILLKIFTPVILLSCCAGILLLGSMLYFVVYIQKKKRLFLTILIMGILGFIFTISEVIVIILSVVQNPHTALIFHRIEAVSALFFCFALPMLLSDILELGKKFKKFNAILYRFLLLTSIIIVMLTVINPETFISSTKPEGALITPWNFGRGTPSVLYHLRDVLIFFSVFYTFIFITIDIFIHKRVRYLGLILTGIIIGIISGATDIIFGIMEIDRGHFSSRIFSYFGFGLTIFILLSMVSVLRWFLDQTRDIENARKIESLGLFAGGIAHDFNNILTGILGNTSLLMNNSKSIDTDNEILPDIEKAVSRAKNLTMQLLTFSRGGSPVKDITSIKNIVEETTRFVLAGSDVKPRIFCDDNLLHAEADAGQISQVIQNLVLNARDAMTDIGGFIDIKMENVKTPPPSLANLKNSDFIKIEIKDYGKGIHEKILPYIFDPYYTTKNSGTGLGLSISYSIIRKHGGEITVKSKPGEETSFTIFLPANTKKQLIESVTDLAGTILNAKILVMDDDPFIRPMIKKMLEHIGLTVVTVNDGEMAITELLHAKNSNIPFDAVIMDLTIAGGMGGVKTSQKVREIDPYIPLIVASGYCDDPVMSDYKCYGFNDRLLKPFTLEDLRKTLISVLNSKE